MKRLLSVLFLFPLLSLAVEFVQDVPVTDVEQTFGVEFNMRGELHICSVGTHQVFKQVDGKLELVAGVGQPGHLGDKGPATEAHLNEPYEIRFDNDGNVFIVEMKNHLIRTIDTKGVIHTLAGSTTPGFAGDGKHARHAKFNRPHSIALDEKTGWLYVADIGNHRIRRINTQTGLVETFAGTGAKSLPEDGEVVTGRAMIGPRALYIQGRTLWVALREGHSVWKIDLDNRIGEHVAGTGKKGYSGDGDDAKKCTFHGPKGIVVQPLSAVYVVDTENQAIRSIGLRDGLVRTIAGPNTNAGMARPHGICLDPQGRVYVGDTNNHRVTRLTRK